MGIGARVLSKNLGSPNEPSPDPGDAGHGRRATAPAASLNRAARAWAVGGRAAPLERWLGRHLDEAGLPRTGAVGDWAAWLGRIQDALDVRSEGLPDPLVERAGALSRSVLRFCRPDGRLAWSVEDDPAAATVLRRWATGRGDEGMATVLGWWGFGDRRPGAGPGASASPPPLPAVGATDRPLAILRANWGRRGDFLAVDGRSRSDRAWLELVGGGIGWLGPGWVAGPGEPGPAHGRGPCRWLSTSNADLFEWSSRTATGRLTRTVALLRGRPLALIATAHESRSGPVGEVESRFDLMPGVVATPLPDARGLVLRHGRERATLLPLGLPSWSGTTERGSMTVEDGRVVVRQRADGRRAWLPIVVRWGPWPRPAPRWRRLTVVQESRVVAADRAVAARVAWGRDDGLVVYRSLDGPALRSFLGYQTESPLIVGLFDREGKLRPLVDAP